MVEGEQIGDNYYLVYIDIIILKSLKSGLFGKRVLLLWTILFEKFNNFFERLGHFLHCKVSGVVDLGIYPS